MRVTYFDAIETASRDSLVALQIRGSQFPLLACDRVGIVEGDHGDVRPKLKGGFEGVGTSRIFGKCLGERGYHQELEI